MRRRRLNIGIDTGSNKRYSCIVTGTPTSIHINYKMIEELFKKHNTTVLHWNEIRKDVRKKAERSFFKILINARTISIRIFEHDRGQQPAKHYYLEHVTDCISKEMKWIGKWNGNINIFVHDDYTVKGVPNSTFVFIENLIRRMSRHLSKSSVGIKIRKPDSDVIISTFKHKENTIQLIGRKSYQQEHKCVTLSDLALGYFLSNRKLFCKKIIYKKI